MSTTVLRGSEEITKILSQGEILNPREEAERAAVLALEKQKEKIKKMMAAEKAKAAEYIRAKAEYELRKDKERDAEETAELVKKSNLMPETLELIRSRSISEYALRALLTYGMTDQEVYETLAESTLEEMEMLPFLRTPLETIGIPIGVGFKLFQVGKGRTPGYVIKSRRTGVHMHLTRRRPKLDKKPTTLVEAWKGRAS